MANPNIVSAEAWQAARDELLAEEKRLTHELDELADGNQIYRTYSTTQRGVDRLLFTSNILDLTPWGRQEAWEDSPDGAPRGNQRRQSVEA